jgi:putative ATP-dependent endonuclease of OLD family
VHLTEVFAEGFRCFGTNNPLKLVLGPGITTLVGENDSGKTAVIDAIRLALGTRGEEYLRLQEGDFHVAASGRAESLIIRCTLERLSAEDESRFLEWCTLGTDGCLRLFVTLTGRRAQRIWYERRAGYVGDGPSVDGELREHLRVTYLRPLRDAERELRPGRRSRLSQILAGLPEIRGQEKSEASPSEPKTLTEILRWTDQRIQENQAIKDVETRINDTYLRADPKTR